VYNKNSVQQLFEEAAFLVKFCGGVYLGGKLLRSAPLSSLNSGWKCSFSYQVHFNTIGHLPTFTAASAGWEEHHRYFRIFTAMENKKYSLEGILTNLRIDALNEMQEASIETNKRGGDIILLSATGSGKTLAFLLPVLELLDDTNKNTTGLNYNTIKRTGFTDRTGF
jgi:hypothetical protein